MTAAHVLHRWVAAFVAVVVATLAVVAWRTQRDHPTLVRLSVGAAVLFAIQVVIGGAQVLTGLAEWTQTLHLALGAVIWAMPDRADRHQLLHGAGRRSGRDGSGAGRRSGRVARHADRAATRSAPTSR